MQYPVISCNIIKAQIWKLKESMYYQFKSTVIHNHVNIKCKIQGELTCNIMGFIIQQIVTMPIYSKEALNICHPYMTDILRYT